MPTDDSVMRSIVLPVPPDDAGDTLTRASEPALAEEAGSRLIAHAGALAIS